jgi:hypothetical protein
MDPYEISGRLRNRKARDIFPAQIEEVRDREITPVRRINIDLALAIVDQPYNIAGNFFYVWSTPETDSYIDIKVNNNLAGTEAPYYQQTGQKVPFDRLYITTPAGQTGNLILLYGTEWPDLVSLIDNRAAVSQDVADMLAELQIIAGELQGDLTFETFTNITVNAAPMQISAANANRKFAIVTVQTPQVYIGLDNTVAANKNMQTLAAIGNYCYFDDYRGPIWGLGNGAGRLVTLCEW